MADLYFYGFIKLIRQVKSGRLWPLNKTIPVFDLNIIYHHIHLYNIYWFHAMNLIYPTKAGLSRQTGTAGPRLQL